MMSRSHLVRLLLRLGLGLARLGELQAGKHCQHPGVGEIVLGSLPIKRTKLRDVRGDATWASSLVLLTSMAVVIPGTVDGVECTLVSS